MRGLRYVCITTINHHCLVWILIKDHSRIWEDHMFWIKKILAKTKIVTSKICPSCSSQSLVDLNLLYQSLLRILGRRKRRKSSLMICLLRLPAPEGTFKHSGQEKQLNRLRNYLKIIILLPWQSVGFPRKAPFRLVMLQSMAVTIRWVSLRP